mgnify:CR=1 FL=1
MSAILELGCLGRQRGHSTPNRYAPANLVGWKSVPDRGSDHDARSEPVGDSAQHAPNRRRCNLDPAGARYECQTNRIETFVAPARSRAILSDVLLKI